MTAFVNKVLDRAERMPWIPLVGGLSLGGGISGILWHTLPGWPLLIAALLLTLARPLGTDVRRRYRIRRLRDARHAGHKGGRQ